MKRDDGKERQWLGTKDLNSILAYAASMMLTGVPPVVCDLLLEEVFGVMRESLGKISV